MDDGWRPCGTFEGSLRAAIGFRCFSESNFLHLFGAGEVGTATFFPIAILFSSELRLKDELSLDANSVPFEPRFLCFFFAKN